MAWFPSEHEATDDMPGGNRTLTNPLDDQTIWGLPGTILAQAIPDAEAFSTTPLLDLLRAGAARDPEAIALVGQTASLNYADLLRGARNVACAVAEHVPPRQALACLVPSTPEGVAGLLGCLIAGRLCVVLDPAYPADRHAAVLQEVAPAMLILAEPLPFAHGIPVLALRDVLAGPACDGYLAPAWQPDHAWDPDAPFAVYFTSGSTGHPKGIVVSARYVLHRASCIAQYCALTEQDCLFHSVAPITAHGLACQLGALFQGARVLVAAVATEGVGAILRLIEREGVTCATIPPPILRLLFQLNRAKRALRSVRTLRIASTALSRAEIATWRPLLSPDCEIWHNYSSTEAQNVAEWLVPVGDAGEEPTVAAGFLQPCHDYAVLGEDDRPVPSGEPGELVIRSRYIAMGEWRNGRLVSGRTPPVPGRPGWRYFRTGDVVRLQPDGMLRVVGRADRQVKINGIRVEPAEIEAIIRAQPGVTDAVVLADSTSAGVTLHGLVEAANMDQKALIEALRLRLAAALPMALRPSRLTVLDRLPMLPSGKIDLTALSRTAQS
jgi:acyl-coenzyme A synthetase/AMP-(fatty) acid ligase